MADDLPQVLDTAMVADLLSMNVQVVRKMAREGTLPAYRFPGGRSFRFFRDEILEWLRSHPVTTGQAAVEHEEQSIEVS
jgi:excisionase family DNA binding protein